MAVRSSTAVAAAVVAGALGLGALGWAAGALPGQDDEKDRCRGWTEYEQPSGSSPNPRG